MRDDSDRPGAYFWMAADESVAAEDDVLFLHVREEELLFCFLENFAGNF